MNRRDFLKLTALLPLVGLGRNYEFARGILHAGKPTHRQVVADARRKYRWVTGPFATPAAFTGVHTHPTVVIYGQLLTDGESQYAPGRVVNWAKQCSADEAPERLKKLDEMWPKEKNWSLRYQPCYAASSNS